MSVPVPADPVRPVPVRFTAILLARWDKGLQTELSLLFLKFLESVRIHASVFDMATIDTQTSAMSREFFHIPYAQARCSKNAFTVYKDK